jgi:hypothetical protein
VRRRICGAPGLVTSPLPLTRQPWIGADEFIAPHAAERQPHLAVRAAVVDGARRARGVAEDGDLLAEQFALDRARAQVGRAQQRMPVAQAVARQRRGAGAVAGEVEQAVVGGSVARMERRFSPRVAVAAFVRLAGGRPGGGVAVHPAASA